MAEDDLFPEASDIAESLRTIAEIHLLQQQIMRYQHMVAIADQVQARHPDTDLWERLYYVADLLLDDILIRRELATEGQQFQQMTGLRNIPDAIRQRWSTADDQILTAAYAQYECAGLAAVYLGPSTLDELLWVGPDSAPEPAAAPAPALPLDPCLDSELDAHWDHLERTVWLGGQVAAERPAWSAHLGPLPAGAVSRADWITTAGHIAAWREQHDITDPTTLLGDRPDHDPDRADRYDELTRDAHRLRTTDHPMGPEA
ncbi:Uncharacterised protein [Nocardia otitidiscaviarum]|uniref:Uncharacterized protein n=1 Tax=Nocardia otitidiscaviarum TaxID=1823 RepID=A0A379JM61_9NOCA|nr:hypothetical protein [Nocardia otitidiscaviarum]SUD49588.1 Uncharacterised protein [Nocardia otitidiscaviarum]